jgi:hypothetical protein
MTKTAVFFRVPLGFQFSFWKYNILVVTVIAGDSCRYKPLISPNIQTLGDSKKVVVSFCRSKF